MQTKEILEELNDAQREAVTYDGGPLMVVAGAGTGKTKVIISKIAYLISEKKAKPSEILAITFTKKAAAEMEERLDIVLPYGYNDVKACNFHSLAEEFLRENAYSLGYSTAFKILTEPQQILFIRDHIFDFNLKVYRPLGDPTRFVQDMIHHFSHLKDELIGPYQYLEFAQNLSNKADSKIEKEYAEQQLELAYSYKTYQELMALNDRMDFGDLIFNMNKALREKEQLLSNFRKKYKYILVDEFQDTNFAQNELLKVLTLEIPNDQCPIPNKIQNPKNLQLTTYNLPTITVVGDDDQSIYKFRGADISNILEFKENWEDTKQVVLTENYRNTQEILDASYKLIQFNNPDRLETKYGINKKLNSNMQNGKKPELLFFENATEEAANVAEEIRKLKEINKEIKYSDFAILIRSNNQALPFTNALSGKKIPYLFTGNEGLFRKSIIKNVIAFFSILINPADNLALFNLLVGEFVGVDFDRISVVLHKVRSKNIPLEEYLRTEDEKVLEKDLGKGNLENIKEILEILQNIRRESITASAGEVLYKFISDSGYLKKLATNEKKGDMNSGEKIVSISHFFDRILGFQEANLDVGIQKFMEYLNLLLEIGEDPTDEMDDPTYDAVKILTIHGAKGLEFKYVFMVGLSDSKFPSRNMGDPIRFPKELKGGWVGVDENEDEPDSKTLHLAEERRLFYVGMTRAAERLYLTFGRDYGGKKSVKISRFVVEALGTENVNPEYSKQTELERIEHFAPKEVPLYSTRLKLKDEKLRLSRAEVDDYLTCPRKYKFIHITPIKLMTNHQIIFGRAIHKVIEEYYKAKISNDKLQITNKSQIQNSKTLNMDQLLEIYKQNWSSEGFISAEHEKQRYDEGIGVIKKFVAEYSNNIEVLEIEKPFKFEIENNIIEGRIDALEKTSNGGVGIIDFKTSEIDDQKKADNRARDNTQLGVYALAIKELTGELPERVGLFFLMNGIVGAFTPTETSLEKVKENIIRASNGIRAQEFTATPSKMDCENCPFSRYCDDSVV
ncbi:MAG TPA: ATP-dependent DNA helicase [Patescibacteria group bacterium]|nr:ATP-dependent DNA helicase [Patescibacteria group bacterium]